MYLFIIANCYLQHTVLFTGGYLLRITTFLSPLRYNTSAYIHPFHIARVLRGMLFPFFYAKVVRGLHLPQGQAFRFVRKISTLSGSIFLQNLVFDPPLYLFLATKRNQHTPALWTHKKNVTMDKQKVNTKFSIGRKGNSSSSHYRIKSGEVNIQLMAVIAGNKPSI